MTRMIWLGLGTFLLVSLPLLAAGDEVPKDQDVDKLVQALVNEQEEKAEKKKPTFLGDPEAWTFPHRGQFRFEPGESVFWTEADPLRQWVYRWYQNDGTRSTGVAVNIDGDGKLTVKIDGEEVDEKRIRRKGDDIEVLDEDGDVLLTFKAHGGGLVMPPGASAYFPFATQKTKRPMIGINMQPVGEALAYHLEIDDRDAVVINNVAEGQAAAKAGVRKFDVVIAIDGERGVTMESLTQAVADKKAGDELTLTVLRRGRKYDIEVEVEEIEAPTWSGVPFLRDSLELFRAPHSNTPELQQFWKNFGDQQQKLKDSLEKLDGSRDRLFYLPDQRSWRWNVPKATPEQQKKPDRSPAGDAFQRLEERMKRLEKMIERLNEKSF